MSYALGLYRCPRCMERKPLQGRKRIANAFWCAECHKIKTEKSAAVSADKNNATFNGL